MDCGNRTAIRNDWTPELSSNPGDALRTYRLVAPDPMQLFILVEDPETQEAADANN
jgi:hypothetical protein